VTGEAPLRVGYAGLVTRALAIAIDVLVIDALAILIGGAIQLIASLLGHQGTLSPLQALIGGVAWLLWGALYFVLFWALTGQTPGDRVMGIRVLSVTSDRIHIRQAFLRFGAMLLAALPLGAGFLPVLVDDQRRGLHDRIAKTVVRWDEEEVTAIPESPVVVAPMAELPPGPDTGTMPAGHAPIA
jgi:uncharacterized RDD family membrane protein YckC